MSHNYDMYVTFDIGVLCPRITNEFRLIRGFDVESAEIQYSIINPYSAGTTWGPTSVVRICRL